MGGPTAAAAGQKTPSAGCHPSPVGSFDFPSLCLTCGHVGRIRSAGVLTMIKDILNKPVSFGLPSR